ncbi:MAG TPA: tetratricopeptide repeat protein, partial [Flavobacteriales bacterium]|nr:tetratricopeptide repeat protein [Flavobacteriales bacterium]
MRINPDYGLPYYNLGNLYQLSGKHRKAIPYLKRAIEINPDSLSAHHTLGYSYREIFQYQEAIDSFHQTLRIKPDHADAHLNLGFEYYKLAQPSAVIKNTVIARILFERQKNSQGAAQAKANLRSFAEQYKNYRIEDFDNVQIPEPSQPSSPALPPVAQAPPQSQQPPKSVESVYSGTGFLFSAKDYVITNWHVVRGTNNIKVKFLNGEKIKAEVALKDPQNDIAFLKLERQPQLPPSNLKIGDSSSMKMGDKVFTIGYPAHFLMGDNPKYTEGVVNATSGLQDDPTV